ncbi:MBL fold metallo-hydrolase [Virgibacillus sp. YIM 98842]|uniref:ComEC/Rec2 family competence protein n=1 Tax=Virgibacillus sp. YIM 98842 TaxID=2663533 RepID=UPI0013DC4633|nr:MBL fold metallo-hydrolase [Virgibacillus sp. YIM 98842]
MRNSKIIIAIFITFLIYTSMPLQIYSQSPMDLQVHFIDVGQGDSILIQTPTEKNILIDGGPPEAGSKVVSYLKEQDIETIDLLVATHPDMDHIGGLPHVMKEFKVKNILDSGKLHSTRTYAAYLHQIRKQDIPVQIAMENEKIRLDPELTILVLNTYGATKTNNQSSIVLKLTYEEIDFLLMSDIEMEQEKNLMEEYDVEAEVIKVAHHGSNTSSSLPFLQAVNPEIALLTYSQENDFGHPVDRVINNLNKINAMIYSTAAFGDIVIRTDGKNYVVLPQENPLHRMIDTAG